MDIHYPSFELSLTYFMQNIISPENTKLYYIKSLNTLDRSCEVEIGKSSDREENLIELRVRATITDLLQKDPYEIHPTLVSEASLEAKCELLSKYFENKQRLKEYQQEKIEQDQSSLKSSNLSQKRKILQKFLDNQQEDEILNKDLSEIPDKLREEIESCKQVIRNLLEKKDLSGEKLMNYLEILYECGLLKIHSDPICLFIHDSDLKVAFEDVIKLTRLSNTYKTYILRLFLSLENGSLGVLENIEQELISNKLFID